MTLDDIYEKARSLTERIHVLEAERVADKYIQPLYVERKELLRMINAAEGTK